MSYSPDIDKVYSCVTTLSLNQRLLQIIVADASAHVVKFYDPAQLSLPKTTSSFRADTHHTGDEQATTAPAGSENSLTQGPDKPSDSSHDASSSGYGLQGTNLRSGDGVVYTGSGGLLAHEYIHTNSR